MLPATNDVPDGIVSATIAVPSASPVLVTTIVYSIISPAFTLLFAFCFSVPSGFFIVAVFSVVITGVSTDGFSSSVGVPSLIIAVFFIEPVTPSFTVTVNDTVTSPLAGTVTSIPLFNSSSEYVFSSLLTVTPAL